MIFVLSCIQYVTCMKKSQYFFEIIAEKGLLRRVFTMITIHIQLQEDDTGPEEVHCPSPAKSTHHPTQEVKRLLSVMEPGVRGTACS